MALKNLVTLLGRCTKFSHIPIVDQGNILAVVQPLWPNLEVTKNKIREQFKAQGMSLEEGALEKMPVLIPSKDTCPTVELLNEKSTEGPFRLTSQMFGTCYVHSTVRALDYYNYSHGSFTKPTSIVATEVSVNQKRPGQDPQVMEGGFALDVFQFLQSNGGCQKNELDRFASDYPVHDLHQFFLDLNSSQDALLALPELSREDLAKPLNQMSQATLTKLMSWMSQMATISGNWQPSTIDILNVLVSGERKEAKNALEQNQIMNAVGADTYVKKIILATLEFREKLRTTREFLSFATFLVQKTYCLTNENRFHHIQYVNLTPNIPPNGSGAGKLSPTKMKEILRAAFIGGNPQPVLMSYFADVLSNPNAAFKKEPHLSVVVGMDYRKNKCMVHILNSWGKTSSRYDSSYEVDEKTGSLWVPIDTLSDYVFQLEQFR